MGSRQSRPGRFIYFSRASCSTFSAAWAIFSTAGREADNYFDYDIDNVFCDNRLKRRKRDNYRTPDMQNDVIFEIDNSSLKSRPNTFITGKDEEIINLTEDNIAQLMNYENWQWDKMVHDYREWSIMCER